MPAPAAAPEVPTVAPADPYVSAAYVAARCGVSVRTVRTWTADGVLPAPIRLGPALVRYRLAELDAWLARGRRSRDLAPPAGAAPSPAPSGPRARRSRAGAP